MSTARLIIDEPLCGVWNMAVDEALLESAAEEGRPTLRFYQWREPTLSLGYFQFAADRNQHQASSACPLVRRSTGGGAILHDRELTYSFALPRGQAGGPRMQSLYYAVHETLVEALADQGIPASLFAGETLLQITGAEPFLCFERRATGDVLVRGAKICGSAQRRRKNALLQHGSVLLAHSTCAQELPGVQELAGVHLSAVGLTQAWIPRLERRLEMRFENSGLTETELLAAKRLEAEKFGHAGWSLRR